MFVEKIGERLLEARIADRPRVEHAMRGNQVGATDFAAIKGGGDARVKPESVGVDDVGPESFELRVNVG